MPNLDLIDLKRYETQRADQETTKEWDDDSLEKLLQAQNLAKTKLKQIVRRGVPDGIRSIVWPEFLKMHTMPEYDKNYTKALFRVHGHKPPESIDLCPLFGGSMFTEYMCLSPKGYLTAGRLLSIIQYDYPQIDFCPFLPVLVVLLLHHIGPDDSFGSINWMIKKNISSSKQWMYFPTYKRDIKALNYAFTQILKQTLPKISKHLDTLNITDRPLWARWFCDFFIGVFPINIIFHILDSFLIEGYKIMFRYALSLIELRSSLILTASTWDQIVHIFYLNPPHKVSSPISPQMPVPSPTPSTHVSQTQLNQQHLPSPTSPPSTCPTNIWSGNSKSQLIDIPKLYKAGFSYQFSKKKILEFRNTHHLSRTREGSLTDINAAAGLNTGIIELPKLLHSEDSAFMTNVEWQPIWKWIPNRHKLAGLEMVFTTRKHGRALSTFYDLCREREPTILIIETMDGSVFGAFCPVSWPLSKAGYNQFFGTGETFVFSLKYKGAFIPTLYPWVNAHSASSNSSSFIQPVTNPNSATTTSAPASPQGLSSISEATSCFMRASSNELIIGGGGNGQAIWIEQNMIRGSSTTCATFQNSPLCEPTSFEISVLEVYSFRH